MSNSSSLEPAIDKGDVAGFPFAWSPGQYQRGRMDRRSSPYQGGRSWKRDAGKWFYCIGLAYNSQPMEQILSRTAHRRAFFLVVALLFILALVSRFYVLPQFNPRLSVAGTEVIARILEAFFSSLVVTVLIGTFVFWFTPKVMQIAKLEPIEPREIAPLLEIAMQTTDIWWFRGGIGRYTRAMTLPSLANAARHGSSTRQITIQILDPGNRRVCREYALYRSGVRSASLEREPWTELRVRRELLVTILSVYIKKAREPLLHIRLILASWFSTFRLDLSSHHVVLTREDHRAPAMRCDPGTYFYRAYRDDLELTARQGKPLAEAIPEAFDPGDLTATSVRQLFVSLAIDLSDITDNDLKEIVTITKANVNPYA